MGARRSVILGLAVLPLVSCSVVKPLIDPTLRNAGAEACTDLADDGGAVSGGANCLNLFRRGPAGGFVASASNRIGPGETLFASPSGAAGCAGGTFTYGVLTADTEGSGNGELGVADAVGRQQALKEIEWNGARTGARWAVGGIDNPLQIAGTLHVTARDGTLVVRQLCYARP